MLRIWLIDDNEEVHQVTDRTIALLSDAVLTRFYSGSEALVAFARLASGQPTELPAIILMDFFIGDERGDVVTAALRDLEPASVRPTIVGYSSMQSASERIINCGGDVVVRKHRSDDGVNPSLYRFLLERPGSR